MVLAAQPASICGSLPAFVTQASATRVFSSLIRMPLQFATSAAASRPPCAHATISDAALYSGIDPAMHETSLLCSPPAHAANFAASPLRLLEKHAASAVPSEPAFAA